MKRTILIVGGVAVLVALLAGAAFVAGRMWGTEASPDDTLAGLPPVLPSEGETTGATMMVEIKSAGDLPQRPPDSMGVFSRREDNRIFVSSSGQGVMIMVDSGGVSDPDATEVEVVVTSETTVYEDVTQESFGGGPPSGETIEQKLEPGQVEEIGESSIVMAWGEKRGERLVADILVYTGPPVIVRSP